MITKNTQSMSEIRLGGRILDRYLGGEYLLNPLLFYFVDRMLHESPLPTRWIAPCIF